MPATAHSGRPALSAAAPEAAVPELAAAFAEVVGFAELAADSAVLGHLPAARPASVQPARQKVCQPVAAFVLVAPAAVQRCQPVSLRRSAAVGA